MPRTSTIFLQGVVVAIGVAALAFMLWEPHLEGRNVNATVFEVYFKDPFLAGAYTVSIAFFVGLYQIFNVLGYIRHNQTFSLATVKAVRTIKYCALILIACIAAAEAYLFAAVRGTDDIAGGVAMGLVMIVVFVVTAAAAMKFEGVLQNAMDTKPKKKVTV